MAACPATSPGFTGNHVLDRLPAIDRERLIARSEALSLGAGPRRVHAYRGELPVLFPLTSVSVLTVGTAEGRSLEAAMVGSEGVIGVAAMAGIARALWDVVTVIPGEALAIPRPIMRRELEERSHLQDELNRQLVERLDEAATIAVCNHFHDTTSRLARMLLMIEDRAPGAPIPLTHDSLSDLLGVHRPIVTASLSALRRRGTLSTVRRRITIEDRATLEAAACSCYDTLRLDRAGPVSRTA